MTATNFGSCGTCAACASFAPVAPEACSVAFAELREIIIGTGGKSCVSVASGLTSGPLWAPSADANFIKAAVSAFSAFNSLIFVWREASKAPKSFFSIVFASSKAASHSAAF